jgi:hypothetical protein
VVQQSAPKACLGKTNAESFGWVWVVSWVGKGVQALKLLDLNASAFGGEGTDQRGYSRPQVRATQNAVHEPAVPARVSLAKLILDEGLLGATFLATEEEVLFPLTVGSSQIPAMSKAILRRIAPSFSVVHANRYCAASDFTRIKVRYQPQLG